MLSAFKKNKAWPIFRAESISQIIVIVWCVHSHRCDANALECAHSGIVMSVNRPFGEGTYLMQQGLLGFRPANERRRYYVTPPLIGWAQD